MDGAMPEDELWAATKEALRTPKGRIALVLRLSQLPPPLPRPHHRRIAYAILEEAAHRHQGRLFLLENGDALLLCRTASGGASSPGADPAELPHVLGRLFRVDVTNPATLMTVWSLERSGDALLTYVARARSGHASDPTKKACA
jgi:hypothetical protein